MEHLAIDLGSRESQVCLRDSSGQIQSEQKLHNSMLPLLFERPPCRILLETCAEAFTVAEQARERGHDVRVVPATLVRSLGVGARRLKTDRRDAQALSGASCRVDLPSVHVPSSWSQEAKSICGMRDALISSRTKLVNSVRGWLRRKLLQIRSTPVTLSRRLSAEFERRGQLVPAHVQRQLAAIDALTEQIRLADSQIVELANGSATCQLLRTAPGIGSLTAVRYVAALDRIDRFAGAHQVQSYLGLTPGEDSSSTRKRLTSITKAGSSTVRWMLIQAAWSALRYRPHDPMCLWSRRIAERRGKAIAVTALARKLAGILYAMWRDSQPYQAQAAAPTC